MSAITDGQTPLTELQRYAEERLKFSNSFNRADALYECFEAQHPDWIKLLGDEWSGCDFFPSEETREMLECLPEPALEATSEVERNLELTLGRPSLAYSRTRMSFRVMPRVDRFAALSLRATVPCYRHRRTGFRPDLVTTLMNLRGPRSCDHASREESDRLKMGDGGWTRQSQRTW